MRYFAVLLLFFVTLWIPSSQALSCKSCHSASSAACVRDPSTVLEKDCPVNDTACATVLISATGHLFRGCSSDAECVAEGEACEKCDTFAWCNSLRYPPQGRLNCNICEASSNKNCITLPYYKQFEKPCLRHVQEDRCVTIFDGYQIVRRECRSGLSEDDLVKCGSAECVTCSGDGCNKLTVRQDDSCLQCTSHVMNCANGRKATAVCSQISDGICYNRLNVDGRIHRGCLSDLTAKEQQYCQDPNNFSCETCSGVGCNNNLYPANALQCVECDSEKDLNCVQQQVDDALVTPCRLQINGDKCYTRLHSDGSFDRGCHSSLSTPCGSQYNVTCAICDGGTCNRDVYPRARRSCFQCDGLVDQTCGLERTGTNGSMVCRRFLQQDKCYTLLENGKVTRGCTSDYKVDVCKGLERTQCQTCELDHCNRLSEVGLRSNSTRMLFCALVVLTWVLGIIAGSIKYSHQLMIYK